MGINYLTQNQVKEDVTFVLDSLLVVNQLSGKFKINNANLLTLFKKINAEAKTLNGKIFYTYVPREKNKEADKLVNFTLDENR